MNIGCIGTGVMGKPMARNLLGTGSRVAIFARHPEKVSDLGDAGAEITRSLAALASTSDCIFLSLPSDREVEEVLLGQDGILQAARPQTVIVDTTTGSPQAASRMAAAAARCGMSYLDAPVSGGVKGAREGTLTIMLGGDSSVVDRIRPILHAVGRNVYLVGPVGAGRTLKALNQMMAGLNAAVVCESLVLARKAGISDETFLSVLGTSSANSYQLQTKLPQFIIPGTFKGGFRIDLMLKDLDIALELARELQTPTMLAAVATQMYRAAGAAGYGDKDTSSLVGFLSAWSDGRRGAQEVLRP